MTSTAQGAATPAAGPVHGLWRRQIDHYPDTRPRMTYLAIVVLATIALYYAFYIPGAVSPSIIAHYGMTFNTYVYIIVIANAVGAFGSLAAGLADRWGRANLVAYGLVIVGLLVLFGVPNAPNTFTYGLLFALVGVVEGIILVVNAAAAAPGQWKDWWWVCVGGEVVFIPLILLMAGRWSPRRAREAHARRLRPGDAGVGSVVG